MTDPTTHPTTGATDGAMDGAGTDPADQDARRLDGNAAAGVLTDMFALDATSAMATCAHCGDRAALGGLLVYADAPALVLRCPSCMQVVLRCASDEGGRRLEMSGVLLLSAPPAG